MTDEKYMRAALQLAKKGRGTTSPNPMVGAVVVKDGRVVGRGYHRRAGQPHAEVIALRRSGEKSNGASLYVNLEPCCHQGRTPPCTDAIVERGIHRVICAIEDPNPLVSGRGVQILQKAGIEVTVGVLEEEARQLNEIYFKYIQTQEPFVIMKVAQTVDGRIATKSGQSKWITSDESRRWVHRLRGQVDAVVIGVGTVLQDDPTLTAHGQAGGDPFRIILDSRGRTPPDAKVLSLSSPAKTIIITADGMVDEKWREEVLARGGEVWTAESDTLSGISWREVIRLAGRRGITSLLIEGGREVFTSAVRAGVVDKFHFIIAPKILGEGTEAIGDLKIANLSSARQLERVECAPLGEDVLITGYKAEDALLM